MIRSNFHHSIRFGDGTLDSKGRFKGYDTYEDWHLIPSSRPTISMPGVETKFVTIPGVDGALDLSQFLRKDRPAYGNRAGTFEFNVENDNEFWMTTYPKIVNVLHGKKFKMVLNEDDPDYYWEGRFTVDKYEPGNGNWSTVAISYQVGPWKMKIRNANEDMVWDNFNFEKDYDYYPSGINNYYVIGYRLFGPINGEGYPSKMTVRSISGSFFIDCNGVGYNLPSGGAVEVGPLKLGNGNYIGIQGSGIVAISWHGGSL